MPWDKAQVTSKKDERDEKKVVRKMRGFISISVFCLIFRKGK